MIYKLWVPINTQDPTYKYLKLRYFVVKGILKGILMAVDFEMKCLVDSFKRSNCCNKRLEESLELQL
jgi:hypothetical protein